MTHHTNTGGKTLRGVVIKTAMKDTATVAVSRYVRHPKYKKYYTVTKKFLAHDPGNTARVGDKVVIKETRPISRLKHFAIVEVASMSAPPTASVQASVPTISQQSATSN